MPRRRKVVVTNQENKEPEVKAPSKSKKAKESEHPAKKLRREPEWMIGDGLNVTKILLSVQKNDCNSNKCLSELQKLYKKMSHSGFMKPFLMTLRAFLIQEDGSEFSMRVLKFIGIFIASFGEEPTESGASHPVVESSFSELLSITCGQLHIRARICSLVTNIMASFSQKAELDESIIEKITERMLYFMKDISPIVRTHAIMALQRLQDPENINEDPVTKAYIHHMESDPAPKVRQAAITAIAKKIHTIPSILERLHDVDEKVRRHTYLQMSSYSVRSYKIVDRIAILNAGLNDRSELVKKAVTNVMLSNWIGVYEFEYSEFIRAIKLDSNEKDLMKFRTLAEMALNEIFKKRKINDLVAYLNLPENNEFKNCLTVEKSTLEMLIVWKMVIKSYQDYIDGKRKDENDATNNDENSEDEETTVNQTVSNIDIIPEMSVFCDYMERFMNEYKFGTETELRLQKIYFNQCIVTLLEIVQLYDLGDEVGKNRLQDLLRSLLSNFDLSEYSIQEITRLSEKIIPNTEQRLSFFNKIVTEMVKPGAPSEYSRQSIIDDLINKSDMDRKLKANDLKLRMMDLKEQESNMVQRKQYAECQRVSEQYHKLNEELIELLKPVAEQHSVESTQSLLENLTVHANIKKITPQEILKNLKICYYSIRSKGIKTITHEVLQIYNEFVRFYLESTDLSTRIWALKTATAYSLLYESIAKEIYIILKSQTFKSVHVLLWECSIECIFDLLLRYSVEKMDGFDNNDQSLSMSSTNRSKRGGRTLYTDIDPDDEDAVDEMYIIKTLDIMQMLSHVLEQTLDKKILKVTIHGMCKLILHGAYSTRELLSKFLLMYFNPATDAEISQMLGIFLENLIKRKKQELLHDALIPTIITLLEAPYDSPLREVKLETVLKYVVEATRPIFCSNGLNLHNTLSMKFLELMKDNPDSKEILKIFSKELLQLEIGEDPLLKKDLIKQIEQLQKDSSADVRTKKYLSDFVSILNGTYRAPLKFSSTAKVQNNEEGDENDIDENEIDENDQMQVPTIPELPEEEALTDESKLPDVSMTGIECKNFDLKVTRLDINAGFNETVEHPLNREKNKEVDDKSILEVNETLTEDIVIAATQPHAEINETNIEHEEIPATQVVEEQEDDDSIASITIISSDDTIPPTPTTPATVIKKAGIRTRKQKNSVDTVDEEEETIPPTPVSIKIKHPATKRQLDISRSTPVTPSVSSPMRKAARRIQSTPKSTPNTPVASTSKVLESPATPTRRLSNLPPSRISTPNTEGRMTRNLAKAEIAQNTTVTRSTSKILNVKPKEPEKEKEPEKKKATASKLPTRKGAPAPPKIMSVRVSSRQAAKPEPKTKGARPPWK